MRRNLGPKGLNPTISSELATGMVIGELVQQSQGGPNIEPPTAAMLEALLKLGGTATEKMLTHAAEVTVMRRQVSSGAAVTLVRTCLVAFFNEHYASRGEKFDDSQKLSWQDWESDIKELDESLAKGVNDTRALHILEWGLLFSAATPVKERILPEELVVQVVHDRFPNGIRALDAGCSIAAGSLNALYKAEYPMKFDPGTLTNKKGGDLSDKANVLLSASPRYREIVGVDVFPAYYPEHQRWDTGHQKFALSGLRPSERNNAQYMDTLKALLAKKDILSEGYDPASKFKFVCANLLDPQVVDQLGTFDVIWANYLTQELSPQERPILNGNLLKLLAENGVLFFEQQTYLHPSNISQPAPLQNIKHYNTYATQPYRSKLYIVDRLMSVQGVQESMTSLDNRWNKRVVIADSTSLVVNGQPEPLTDLIAHSTGQ